MHRRRSNEFERKGGVMMIELEKAYQYSPFLVTSLVYITELYLYLVNFISGFFFSIALLSMSVLIFVLTISVRKLSIPKRPFVFSIIFSVLLLIYEMPLMLIDNHQYLVTSPNTPEELIKGSGIFLLSVNVTTLGFVENEQDLRENYKNSHTEYFEITTVKNHERYSGKNIAILEALGVFKDEFEMMSDNVAGYLKMGNNSIDEFLARDGSSGSSAGLALVLSSLSEQGKFQNEMHIGVTGAINKTGEVKEVGLVKEKIQIANQNGLTHMILPLANLAEAKEFKKIFDLPIEIIGVQDVDEVIQIIKELNDR